MDIITYALCRKLIKGGGGTIKDKFLDSVSIETVTVPDVPEPGYKVGDKYFHFVFKVGDAFLKEINLLASDLLPKDVLLRDDLEEGLAIKFEPNKDDEDKFSINVKVADKKGIIINSENELEALLDEEKTIIFNEDGSIAVNIEVIEEKLEELFNDIYVLKAGCEMDNNAYLTIKGADDQDQLTGAQATYDVQGLEAIGTENQSAKYTADGITVESTEGKTVITNNSIETTGTILSETDIYIKEGDKTISIKEMLENMPENLSDLLNDIGVPEDFELIDLEPTEDGREQKKIQWTEMIDPENPVQRSFLLIEEKPVEEKTKLSEFINDIGVPEDYTLTKISGEDDELEQYSLTWVETVGGQEVEKELRLIEEEPIEEKTKLSEFINDIGAPEDFKLAKTSEEGELDEYSLSWLETVDGELEERELTLIEVEEIEKTKLSEFLNDIGAPEDYKLTKVSGEDDELEQYSLTWTETADGQEIERELSLIEEEIVDEKTKLSEFLNDIGAPEDYRLEKISQEGEPEKYSIKWIETVDGELKEREVFLVEKEDFHIDMETVNIVFDKPDFNI